MSGIVSLSANLLGFTSVLGVPSLIHQISSSRPIWLSKFYIKSYGSALGSYSEAPGANNAPDKGFKGAHFCAVIGLSGFSSLGKYEYFH